MMAAVQPSEHLTVHGLPLGLTDEILHMIFSQYGKVEQAKMLDIAPGQTSRGALLEMSQLEESVWLVQTVNANIPQGLEAAVSIQFVTSSPEGLAQPPPPPMALPPPTGPPTGVLSEMAGPFQMGVHYRGTVKRWDDSKGFGFIVPDGGGPDVFVHTKELIDGDKLVNGFQVVFQVMQDPSKGPNHFRASSCKGAVQKDLFQEQTSSVNEKVFMTGLPLDITEAMLIQVFSQYGKVISVKKMPIQPGKADSAALCLMGNAAQADYLVKNLNRQIPTGLTTPVNIRFAENSAKGVSRGGGLQQQQRSFATAGAAGFSSAPTSTAGFGF